jgi:hypothetical protein
LSASISRAACAWVSSCDSQNQTGRQWRFSDEFHPKFDEFDRCG